MIREIELEVLTPKRLLSRDEATKVLDLLCKSSPDFVPAKWGTYEPIRTRFDCADYGPVLDSWGRAFLWKRGRPKSEGSVWPSWAAIHRHGWLTITVDAAKVNVEGLIRFIEEACSILCAHFGLLHLLTDPEISFGRQNRTVGCLDPQRQRYGLTVPGRKLEKYVPDLYWVTVFGEPYVELFGKERLLSAPVPIVREIGGGCIYLQLSDSIYDFETDYEAIDGVRQAVKKHLDCNAFFDPDAPDGQVYNVPNLELEPLPNTEN